VGNQGAPLTRGPFFAARTTAGYDRLSALVWHVTKSDPRLGSDLNVKEEEGRGFPGPP